MSASKAAPVAFRFSRHDEFCESIDIGVGNMTSPCGCLERAYGRLKDAFDATENARLDAIGELRIAKQRLSDGVPKVEIDGPGGYMVERRDSVFPRSEWVILGPGGAEVVKYPPGQRYEADALCDRMNEGYVAGREFEQMRAAGKEDASLAGAQALLCLALGAAGKIEVERRRGASYYHAEVDWLIRAEPAIRAWLLKTGASFGISSDSESIVDALAAELPALVEARKIENSMRCYNRPACTEGNPPEDVLRCYKCPAKEPK
jgi:hypothetical protein